MFEEFIVTTLADADAAHNIAHIKRVVTNAKRLAQGEGANLTIVVPAAWLHDCVVVNKSSPDRKRASTMAAEKAGEFLHREGFPRAFIPPIEHAIAAHSYSANITPETTEAKVVQDADRLDSIGAIGIARCLLTGVSFGAELYDPADPWAGNRELDDKAYSVDHFPVKLFKLVGMMQTSAGKKEAIRRTEHMKVWLDQLRSEIN
ncbi:MAG: HD domain-containing protein [Chloroflexota bacterium]